VTTLCTCPAHQDGAPAAIGEHEFAGDTEMDQTIGLGPLRFWRWLCSCGARGDWQSRSANVSYHAWLWHVDRRSA
jgi:hypothetical protein